VTPAGRDGPRTVLVTGGAQGLGAAMVRRFTSAGHRVAVADTELAAGRRLALATGCLFIPTDVTVFTENQAAVRETVEQFGGLNTVCLNAGIPVAAATGSDFDPDLYRHGVQVNLDGAVYGVNAALPHLRAAGGGAILVTSSLAGIAPAVDPYYAATKHALIGLARSFALILAKDDITVNALCPGFMDTRLIASVRDALIAHGVAIADVEQVAAAAEEVLDSPATGQAWEVQAGRPVAPVEFPTVTLSRTIEQERAPHPPEGRTP
jgi:NAD(P)-dependent dehydrogenase (short-subunit alcohol dehydrogenase family)